MPAINPYAIEYVKGMTARVRKAGNASPKYLQLMSFAAIAIIEPTIMRVQPVAQGGIDAKIGAKKMDMKKHKPVVIAVIPVFPPSEMPAPDSIKAVTGERPKREPIEIPKATEKTLLISKWGKRESRGVFDTHHRPSTRRQNPQNLESLHQ